MKNSARCIFVIVLFVMGLGSCASNQTPHSGTHDPYEAPDAHTSEGSLSWGGVYTGTIPAADSPGIEVRITLEYDKTFELRYQYIGKPLDLFIRTGTFSWDTSGSVITLDAEGFPPYYKVGENYLVQLNMEGKTITGALADRYILRKTPEV